MEIYGELYSCGHIFQTGSHISETDTHYQTTTFAECLHVYEYKYNIWKREFSADMCGRA